MLDSTLHASKVPYLRTPGHQAAVGASLNASLSVSITRRHRHGVLASLPQVRLLQE